MKPEGWLMLGTVNYANSRPGSRPVYHILWGEYRHDLVSGLPSVVGRAHCGRDIVEIEERPCERIRICRNCMTSKRRHDASS